MSDDLDAALDDLETAESRVRAALVRQDLATRPGLAYAPLDDAGTYLVTWDGQPVGYLHHDPADSWLTGWTARTDENAAGEGPYSTPRQAAQALIPDA